MNEAKLLDPKKVLQARPWLKKSPTAHNVTQKKSPIKNNNNNNNSREFQTVFASTFLWLMKLIQLFDIKTRTLGFTFRQPRKKKSLPKSLTPKKLLQNFKPKKVLRSQISNRKKGFSHPRHLYMYT